MTTTLLIQTPATPLTVSFPAIAPMTRDEFYAFCQANRDLRIERTATGEVVIMPPAFSDTGNRNFNLAVQLGIWAEQDGTGLGFDSSAGFTLPNGAIRSPDAAWIKAEKWDALTEEEKLPQIRGNVLNALRQSEVKHLLKILLPELSNTCAQRLTAIRGKARQFLKPLQRNHSQTILQASPSKKTEDS